MTNTRPASTNVLVEVRAALPSLRPAERRIADIVIADPERFATMSIAEIADAASTSTTTVVRFTRRIGYERFKDLRHDLTEQSVRERLASENSTTPATDISRTDRMVDIVAKIARDESLSIADTAETVDIEQLERAVAAIDGATRIDIFGIGGSGIVAVDLQRKLSRIGRVAIEWPESHAAWVAASVLGSGAVAIAVSHSGSTVDTVEFLRLARASGAETIAITNHEQSPLAKAADVVLRTSARESSFRSGALGSRIAQLMVADCLFIGVAQSQFDVSIEALRRTFDAVSSRSTRA